MEGEQLRCVICGEGHEGDNSGVCSSELIQNYVKGLGCSFPEEVFREEEGVRTAPCKDCGFYLKAVVNGMERVKGLTKDVAELERNFRKKLRELKSDGDNVLSHLKLIEESLNERKDGGSEVNQNEIYLQKGTGKACKSLAVAMGDVEVKLDWVKKWANRNPRTIKTEVESSSAPDGNGNEETLRIVSVVSVASTDTVAQHDCFEAGDVFQVKTERDDAADTDTTGEPVLEGAVKLEKEIVRETRQGPVYRTTEVTLLLDTLEIMRATENEKSAGEPMLIDLEEEETRSTDARNKSVLPSPPPSQAIHLEKIPRRNEVDVEESFEKIMYLEVEEEEEIPTVGIVTEEVREHEDKDNFNIEIEASSSKILIETNHTENQKDTASLRKRSIAEVDGSPEKTGKVGVKKPRRIPPSDVCVGGLPIAGNNMDPSDDNDENKKWFTEVTAQLRSKNEIALRKLLKPIPKLNPGLLHELILQLKEENKLCLLTSINFIEFVGDQTGLYPLFHEIFRTMNVEERTLAILSDASLHFNVLDSWKRNVLHSAIQGNQSISLLKSLVKRGADVKQVDYFGENLIHIAVKSGCAPETLEFLVNEGVNVKIYIPSIILLQNVKDPERIFSLFKFLFNAGAHYPDTALPDYYKSKSRNLLNFRELFEFIFSNGKVGWFNTKNSKAATPLHLAFGCWKMDEENLQMLANSQVDFTKIDRNDRGCLHYAFSGGNWSPKILQFLLEKGAPLRETKSKRNRETLLHVAARNRAPWKTFKFLLEKGLQIGRKDGEGYTALDLVIKNSCEAKENVITKLLIKTFDAGVRYSLSNQCPMLHLGIKYGTLEVVKHMLENGADANELDFKGKTPFLNAIDEGYTSNNVEKAKMLRRFGAEIPSEVDDRKKILHDIAESGISRILKYCIEEFEVGVDATLADGKTLLHSVLFPQCFTKYELSKTETLILEGADVNAKPEAEVFVDEIMKLQSPLHLLLYRYDSIRLDTLSFVDILILILERGAKINEKTLEGWNALHILMGSTGKDFLELAKLLVQFGADIRAKTKKGQSVLHIAAETGDIEKIRYCLSEGLDVNALDIDGKTPVEYFIPIDYHYIPDGSTCHLANNIQVLLESGVTAETKANVKKKIETRLESQSGRGVKSALEKFLPLLK